MILAPVQDSW